MDLIYILRSGYITGAAIILLTALFPSEALHRALLDYGSRSSNPHAKAETSNDEKKDDSKSKPPSTPSKADSQVDTPSTFLTVPHNFFLHFYLVSVVSSLFWGWQLLTQGFAFQYVAAHVPYCPIDESMTITQVALIWGCMLIQGSRRFYESWTFLKPSSSRMGVTHYLIGMVYYLVLGVAIWIEGIPAIQAYDTATFRWLAFKISRPSVRTLLSVDLFLIASGAQNDAHRHLSSLVKYTLPDHPLFLTIICPHYTAEVLIYIALMFLGAPQGLYTNHTLAAVLGFVMVNLGVTAAATRRWYVKKFGAEEVKFRWRMVPFLY